MEYYYVVTSSYSKNEIGELNDDVLMSNNWYDKMLDAKKNNCLFFEIQFGSGYLSFANVYFEMKDAICKVIESKSEKIAKLEVEKQQIINEIMQLKSAHGIS